MTTTDDMKDVYEQLAKLREPFPAEAVEKLPRPKWKGAWEDKRASHCNVCHGYHVAENSIHLDYIGHAATTNRLLEVDPLWSWEPLAFTPDGLPRFDNQNGLWIKLTVCGVTRLGYGHAGSKNGGDAVKEVIGDAIRNAAMRFGVALDLWSKSDLHADRNLGDGESRNKPAPKRAAAKRETPVRAKNQDALDALTSICHRYALKPADIANRYADEHDGAALIQAETDDILEFSQQIVLEVAQDAEADPLAESTPTPEPEGDLF